jgi:hypothetical protein
MLPPHIAERTRLDSTTNDSPNIRGRMYPSTHRDHTARFFFPLRVGTRASFDAEQKNRHQTHRRSHSAQMPNIPRARASTLSTHPHSRSRGECSAMCGGMCVYMWYVQLTEDQAHLLETNPSSHQRECYIRTMTTRVQSKKKISDREPQEAWRQDKLVGGKLQL